MYEIQREELSDGQNKINFCTNVWKSFIFNILWLKNQGEIEQLNFVLNNSESTLFMNCLDFQPPKYLVEK